jgi:hypothetical protein
LLAQVRSLLCFTAVLVAAAVGVHCGASSASPSTGDAAALNDGGQPQDVTGAGDAGTPDTANNLMGDAGTPDAANPSPNDGSASDEGRSTSDILIADLVAART